MRNIISLSFGKDSMASLILAYELGIKIDCVIYCEVLFDDTTSAEVPEHAQFIKEVAIPLIESKFGYHVTVLRSEKTFIDCFHRVRQSGSNEGKMVGFPIPGRCDVNRDLKLKTIHNFFNEIDDEITQFVGIAADEPERLKSLKGNQRSLLAENGYTEAMAREKCLKYGLLSPLYSFTNRNGCFFCPNCHMKELRHLYDNHKDLWNRLKEMSNEQTLVTKKFNRVKTIEEIEEIFYWEDQQIDIFDFLCS